MFIHTYKSQIFYKLFFNIYFYFILFLINMACSKKEEENGINIKYKI